MTRRDLLARWCAVAGVAPLTARLDLDRLTPDPLRVALANQSSEDRLLGRVSMTGPNPLPLNRLVAADLDGRLFTDLSNLAADALITPTDHFFIRTAYPAAAQVQRDWSITVGGLVQSPMVVPVAMLRDAAQPMGTHLLECAGNGDPDNYGLISASTWSGIPVRDLFDRVRRRANATHVEIAGIDGTESRIGTSLPGASWIFAIGDLERTGAFFATHMNGEPLPPHHGAPIRLVVPGWYGCACIKWVHQITFVTDATPASLQMQEFAGRTHQRDVFPVARDYEPATIDHAAMPIRVEKWSRNARIIYRIVGIQWGGETPIGEWLIRTRSDLPFVPVDRCPRPESTRTWSLWTHDWRPDARGRYEIVLRPADPAIRARRMAMEFYKRTLHVDEL